MKCRISCFGHGWALAVPGKVYYVGSFAEAIATFDEYLGQVQISACIDVYRARMGQVQTQGNA